MLNVFIFLLCTVHCLKELHYYIPIVFSNFIIVAGCKNSFKFPSTLPCSSSTAVFSGFALNVQYLYHGTTAPFVQICDEGLDERLSRSGRFGRGIYFRSVLLLSFFLFLM